MSRCEKPLSLQRSQRERRFCDLCLQPIEGMYAGCRSCGFDCCPRCVDPASQPTHVCVPLDVATRMHLFVELCQTADGLEDAHPSAIAAQEQLSAAQIDYQGFLAKRAEHARRCYASPRAAICTSSRYGSTRATVVRPRWGRAWCPSRPASPATCATSLAWLLCLHRLRLQLDRRACHAAD